MAASVATPQTAARLLCCMSGVLNGNRRRRTFACSRVVVGSRRRSDPEKRARRKICSRRASGGDARRGQVIVQAPARVLRPGPQPRLLHRGVRYSAGCSALRNTSDQAAVRQQAGQPGAPPAGKPLRSSWLRIRFLQVDFLVRDVPHPPTRMNSRPANTCRSGADCRRCRKRNLCRLPLPRRWSRCGKWQLTTLEDALRRVTVCRPHVTAFGIELH